jgi:hypothetical protein
LQDAIVRLLQECPSGSSLLVFVDEEEEITEKTIEEYLKELSAQAVVGEGYNHG